MILPIGEGTLLIRTDFSDQPGWLRLVQVVNRPSADGFLAKLQVVDDPAFGDADAQILSRLLAERDDVVLLFLADAYTMTHHEMPLLCADPRAPEEGFRAAAAQLWSVENNLALANMDFGEFVGAADADGIFRGFQD